MSCTLCKSPDTPLLCTRDGFDYLHCPVCDLIFIKPGQRLDPGDEKSRYDQHQNDPDDQHYRDFLNQFFEPFEKRLEPNSYGLDFGSGPGPALNIMFEEKGHIVEIFDPFYAPDRSVFEKQFDFITATETAEHLFKPREEFDLLWNCLKPGGYLGIMTHFTPSPDEFPEWYYRRDDTHVAFYSEKTFQWMAAYWNSPLELIGGRVAIFHKPIL